MTPLALLLVLTFLLLLAPRAAVAQAGLDQTLKAVTMVDCLLPGELRRLGRTSFLGPRLPVRTTAERCEIRGGAYVEADRATLASSLAVWKDKAGQGDAQAQFYVGQFYEKGLDVAPDYAQAAKWYRQASAQGHTAATLALVDLMSEGKGMPADPVGAMNLYRQTMGIDDELVRASEADARLEEERQKLLAQKRESDAEISRLRAEIERLRRSAAAKSGELLTMQDQLRALEQRRDDSAVALERLDGPLMRTAHVLPQIGQRNVADELRVGRTNFGRYYALVIGIEGYAEQPLKTPVSDADAVARMLQDQYGFTTTVLHDARSTDVSAALGEFNRTLQPEDNFILYFAGHGIRRGRDSAWVMADGQEYPTQRIASLVGAMQARTVLIIADTCFGGALTGTSRVWSSSGISAWSETLAGNRYYLGNKGRYVLSSGGDAPATDEGSGGHSIFAAALLEALADNRRVLTERGLVRAISGAVVASAQRLGIKQTPSLEVIRDGGDSENGLFFFVPVERGAQQVRAG